MKIEEPTSEQCSQHAKIFEDEHRIGYAIWYPQMGGYAGRALAVLDKHWEELPSGCTIGGCVDVFVWHDGNFPFRDGAIPRRIHHCDPSQFIEFGAFLAKMNERNRKQADAPATG